MQKDLDDEEFQDKLTGEVLVEISYAPKETINLTMASGLKFKISHTDSENNEWRLFQIGDEDDVFGKTITKVDIDDLEIPSPTGDEEQDKQIILVIIRTQGADLAFRFEQTGYYQDDVEFVQL